jgi:hypothetical protein
MAYWRSVTDRLDEALEQLPDLLPNTEGWDERKKLFQEKGNIEDWKFIINAVETAMSGRAEGIEYKAPLIKSIREVEGKYEFLRDEPSKIGVDEKKPRHRTDQIILRRKPPGRPPDQDYDDAYKIIIEGDQSDAAYKEAFNYLCEQRGIKNPGQPERDMFKKAIQRRIKKALKGSE